MSLMKKMMLPLRCANAMRAASCYHLRHSGRSLRMYSSGTQNRHFACLSGLRSGPSSLCFNGINKRLHSQQSQSEGLYSFLDNEVEMELAAWREREKGRPDPQIQGFDCAYDGAMVTLSRRGVSDNEQVTVKFSVSASIDSGEETGDIEDEIRDEGEKAEPSGAALCSRPDFTVDIRKGNKILSFLCSFISPAELAASAADDSDVIDAVEDGEDRAKDSASQGLSPAEQTTSEDFQINEFAIHDADLSSDRHSSVYSADCSVIDGELYDRLLEFLEQRGIDDRFAQQVVRLATAHEHNCYLKLLRSVQKFVKE